MRNGVMRGSLSRRNTISRSREVGSSVYYNRMVMGNDKWLLVGSPGQTVRKLRILFRTLSSKTQGITS